jgi:hypothetical protein
MHVTAMQRDAMVDLERVPTEYGDAPRSTSARVGRFGAGIGGSVPASGSAPERRRDVFGAHAVSEYDASLTKSRPRKHPPRDLQFGVPKWMGTGGMARRTSPLQIAWKSLAAEG